MRTHLHLKTVCVFFALLLIACDEKQDRYQIVTRGAVIMKIDTKTGKSWKWQPSIDGGGEWRPVQESR
jgi:hypothetical protein